MDIGFLRMMPNMVLVSPANGIELKGALKFAFDSNMPVAIRYPKDYVDDNTCSEAFSQPFEMGKSIILRQGKSKLVLIAYGSMVIEALKAAEILTSDNIDITVINARFAKPVDEKIISLLADGFSIITIEDHAIAGGFGSAVLETAAKAGLDTVKVKVLGVCDEFVQADKRAEQFKLCGLSAQKIAETAKKIIKI
jgi:1-deoxy-D-xylulose-5-phosphate synthase